MSQARNRIMLAIALLKSSVISYLKSDEIAGRFQRFADQLRRHPALTRSRTYLEHNLPLWKTRYKESHDFRDKVWYVGIFGIFLLIVLYFSMGDSPEIPMFRIKEDEISFKTGAPQLAFIRADPVVETLLPVGPPVPARVAMDESRTAPVSPSLNGRVVQQHAQLGDHVEAGDPLVTIDAPDYGTALTDWKRQMPMPNARNPPTSAHGNCWLAKPSPVAILRLRKPNPESLTPKPNARICESPIWYPSAHRRLTRNA